MQIKYLIDRASTVYVIKKTVNQMQQQQRAV